MRSMHAWARSILGYRGVLPFPSSSGAQGLSLWFTASANDRSMTPVMVDITCIFY
jgi:hypothetical protein